MNEDDMHKETPYHVTEQNPVKKWRTEIGYKIEQIVEQCEKEEFWKVALQSLAARLKKITDNYVQLYIKFKRSSTDLTEEELDSLCDTACKINDMHRDVVKCVRKYFDTKPECRVYLNACRDAFREAFRI